MTTINQYELPTKCYGITRPDLDIRGAVIHYMSAVNINPNIMFDTAANIKILEDYGFSYHFLIDRAGFTTQLVPLSKQAYHAGKSKFKKLNGCNKTSVGICLLGGSPSQVGPDHQEFTDNQYTACVSILNYLKEHCDKFSDDYIVGHDQVATPKGRKQDPGEFFDWELLNDGIVNWGITLNGDQIRW